MAVISTVPPPGGRKGALIERTTFFMEAIDMAPRLRDVAIFGSSGYVEMHYVARLLSNFVREVRDMRQK